MIINKDMIPKKGMSTSILNNMVMKPNSGITGNLVGQARFTEDPNNSDMDRLKFECYKRCKK